MQLDTVVGNFCFVYITLNLVFPVYYPPRLLPSKEPIE